MLSGLVVIRLAVSGRVKLEQKGRVFEKYKNRLSVSNYLNGIKMLFEQHIFFNI